ncbi:ester cyclase [Rhodopirellula sp. SM50]|nr:ester cyclase [Rhodopirellula sp. SM50]
MEYRSSQTTLLTFRWEAMDNASNSSEALNKTRVTEFIEKVLRSGQDELLSEYVSPTHIDHNNKSPTDQPIEDLRKHIRGFRRAYPDLEVSIDFQIAEGDMVMSRLTYVGTQTLGYLGFGPTGKRMRMVGAKIMRLSGGLIVETWGYFNTLEAFDEFGALRSVDSAGDS